jgi:hypothetical protein
MEKEWGGSESREARRVEGNKGEAGIPTVEVGHKKQEARSRGIEQKAGLRGGAWARVRE